MARLHVLGPVFAVALSACAEGEDLNTFADRVAAIRTSPVDEAPLQVQVVDRRTPAVSAAEPGEADDAAIVPFSPLSPSTGSAAAATGSVAVQLGAFRDEAAARAAWDRLGAGGALAGLQPRFETVQRAEGALVRLKAGPLPTPEAARAVCARLGLDDPWCAKGSFSGPA